MTDRYDAHTLLHTPSHPLKQHVRCAKLHHTCLAGTDEVGAKRGRPGAAVEVVEGGDEVRAEGEGETGVKVEEVGAEGEGETEVGVGIGGAEEVEAEAETGAGAGAGAAAEIIWGSKQGILRYSSLAKAGTTSPLQCSAPLPPLLRICSSEYLRPARTVPDSSGTQTLLFASRERRCVRV